MNKNTLVVLWAVISVIFGAASPLAFAGEPGAAAQPIEALQSSLIESMKAGSKLDYRARYNKLDPVVSKAFDFTFIARLVLGPDWGKLNADQRKAFVAALDQLSVSSYAKEFDSYSGEHFAFTGERDAVGGKLERYAFTTGEGKTIRFDYQMHQADGSWKVVNVIVDGVSDLALKRGQYRKLYKDRGYEGLVAWIKGQIKANAG